jgi:lipoyl(octanoyl) transferase
VGSDMLLNVVNLGRVEYERALNIQYALVQKRKAGEIGNTLLLLEHPHVITLGTRGLQENIYADDSTLEKLGIQVVKVNRGGDVTYHGPGQLVGYPIIHAQDFDRNITAFVRNIMAVFISLLKERFCIEACSSTGKATGIWVGEKKITAIGIAVVESVTMHGFAFNVNTDLKYFDLINPCGLSKGVTSLRELTGRQVDMGEIYNIVAEYFASAFGFSLQVTAIERLLNQCEQGGNV